MRMTRLLFTAAVLLLAWQATAATFGPAFELPVEWVWLRDRRTGLLVRVSSADRGGFAVASNGTDFFVAWSQHALVGTVGPSGEPPRMARAGVFGIRIDAAGNVLDAVPIPLPLSGGEGSFFSDRPIGSIAFAASSDSYLACLGGCVRVDSRGALLDANPIPGGGFALSDGEDHFVLEANRMFLVEPDATVVAHPIAFTVGSVASDGDNFLNVTSSEITLFDSDGATLNRTAMPFQPQAFRQPDVTFDGDKYLILWQGPGPDGAGKYITRVSSDGELLDTSARLAVSDLFGGVNDSGLRISFDGMNAVAAWCNLCVRERNPARIAVIQPEDPIIATSLGGAGPIRMWLAIASNSTGVSVVVVDGVRPFPPNFLLTSFFPVVQFVTTWVPSPERK